MTTGGTWGSACGLSNDGTRTGNIDKVDVHSSSGDIIYDEVRWDDSDITTVDEDNSSCP